MDKKNHMPNVPNKTVKKLKHGKNLNDLYKRLEKIPEPPPMTQEEIFGTGEGKKSKKKSKKKPK